MTSINTPIPRPGVYELLILDYGGTYSFEYDINSYASIMTKAFGKAPDKSEQARIAVFSHKLAEGSIDSEEYVTQVAHVLSVDKPAVNVFESATIEVTHDPSPEMVSLVERVKESGIKVSLLSNMYLFEVIKTKQSSRYDGFDYTAFSAEEKKTKSDPDFFLETLTHFGVSPDKTLFVDDIAAYAAIATSLGMHTITADKASFNSAAQLSQSIFKELGL